MAKREFLSLPIVAAILGIGSQACYRRFWTGQFGECRKRISLFARLDKIPI
jgi:hypothetical protein